MMMTRIQYWKTPLIADKAASSAAKRQHFLERKFARERVDRSADHQRLRGRKQIFQNQRAEPENQASAVLHTCTARAPETNASFTFPAKWRLFLSIRKTRSSALPDCATMSRGGSKDPAAATGTIRMSLPSA